jgi:hypothetical protein
MLFVWEQFCSCSTYDKHGMLRLWWWREITNVECPNNTKANIQAFNTQANNNGIYIKANGTQAHYTQAHYMQAHYTQANSVITMPKD